jgi:hypothetical protein
MAISWSLVGEESGTSPEDVRARRTMPRKDGSFVLGSIPAEVDIVLRAENPYGPSWNERLRLGRGEEREVWVHLERAPTLSGRVVDEEGLPVAEVFLELEGESAVGSNGEPYARTNQDGSFEVQSPAKIVRLTTRGRLAREAEATVDVRNGSVQDVVLSVVRGESIAGTLTWPDASPVSHFELWGLGTGGRRHGEGAGGRFELRGLPPGLYDLSFHAQGEARAGSARVPSVASGTRDLQVVLEETVAFELRGSVVDVQSAPIADFRLNAYRTPRQSESEPRSESATGRDGTFALKGVDPGEWTFYVRAEGHQEVRETLSLEGPTDLVFVLPPAGRVRGVVLDPAGEPAPGAWVGEEHAAFVTRSSGLGRAGLGRDLTDGEGRFDLAATSRSMHLVALSRDHAASTTVIVDRPPGDDAGGVVLQLREAGRIEGRVLDEQGNPVAYARVFAGPGPPGLWQDKTDAQGSFALEGLPPGSFRVTVQVHERSGAVPSADVTLVAGETRFVDLRFEPEDPVRLRARLTLRGRPLACSAFFRSRSFVNGGGSDAAGNLELLLQRPGRWTGFVWVHLVPDDPYDMDANDVRRFEIDVPDADEHSLELEFEHLSRVRSAEELER